MDWVGLLSCFFLSVCISFQPEWISIETLRFIAAMACFTLMLKIFNWLRIFDKTGFFVELIKTTLYDIYPFMILIIVALLTFGLPILLLTLSRVSDTDNASLFSMLQQTLLTQYLISLGEFPLDDWND